ncbi:hypothetical protein BC831DRAFT_451960 [Entophlyctis helioformis]|nr:hypothetical protein BC831DRAFT_451960 [Entophlyctis helioformis]
MSSLHSKRSVADVLGPAAGSGSGSTTNSGTSTPVAYEHAAAGKAQRPSPDSRQLQHAVSVAASTNARAKYRSTKKRRSSAGMSSASDASASAFSSAHLLARPAQTIELEQVLGITASRPAALAVCVSRSWIAVPAGATAVIASVSTGQQIAYAHIGCSNATPRPDSVASLMRSPASLPVQSLRSLSCLAFDAPGKLLVMAETGHNPRIGIWDTENQATSMELHGHKSGIVAVAISPDSVFVVSAGHQSDPYVYLWNWRLGQRIAGVRVASKITGLAFDPLGAYFVTVGHRHVKFWDFDGTGSLPKPAASISSKISQLGYQTLEGRNATFSELSAAVFVDVGVPTLDSSSIPGQPETASAYAILENGVLALFDNSHMLFKWVELKMDYSTCMDVSAKYVACGGSKGIIRLFQPATLQYVATLPSPHPRYVDIISGQLARPPGANAQQLDPSLPDVVSVRILHDADNGDRLVAVYRDSSLIVWDISTPRHAFKVRSSLFHSDCVWGVEAVPGHQHGDASFASCSADGTVRFWSLDVERSSTSGHGFAPEMLQILYAKPPAADEQPWRNEAASPDLVESKRTTSDKAGIRCIKISQDGKLLAAGDRVGTVRIYDLVTLAELASLDAHNAEVMCLDFAVVTGGASPKRMLASASRDRLIHVYDASQASAQSRSFDLVQTLNDHTSTITGLRFCNNGMRLVSCSADKSVIFRHLQASPGGDGPRFSSYQTAPVRSTVYDLAVEQSHEHAVAVTQDRRFVFFDTENGKTLRTHRPAFERSALDASGSQQPIQTPIASAAASTVFVNKIVADPSGLYLAAASSDKCVRLFDFYTGVCVGVAAGHGDLITSLAFIDGGRRIVSAAADGSLLCGQRMARGQLSSPASSPNSTPLPAQNEQIGGVRLIRSELSQASSPLPSRRQAESTSSTPLPYWKGDTPSQLSSSGASPEPGWMRHANGSNSVNRSGPNQDTPSRVPSSAFTFEFDERHLPVWARSSKEPSEDGTASADGQQPLDRALPIPTRGAWAERFDLNGLSLHTEDPTAEPVLVKAEMLLQRRRYSIESQSSPLKQMQQQGSLGLTYSSPQKFDDGSPRRRPLSASAWSASMSPFSGPRGAEHFRALILAGSDAQNDGGRGGGDGAADVSPNEPDLKDIAVHVTAVQRSTIADHIEDDDDDEEENTGGSVGAATKLDASKHGNGGEAVTKDGDSGLGNGDMGQDVQPSGDGSFARELGNRTFDEYLADTATVDRPESRQSLSSQFLLSAAIHRGASPLPQAGSPSSSRSSPIAFTDTGADSTRSSSATPQLPDSRSSTPVPGSSARPAGLDDVSAIDVLGHQLQAVHVGAQPASLAVQASEETPRASAVGRSLPPPPLVTSTSTAQLPATAPQAVQSDIATFKRLADTFASKLLAATPSVPSPASSIAELRDAMRYVHAITSRALQVQTEDGVDSVERLLEKYSDILVDTVRARVAGSVSAPSADAGDASNT